MTIPSDVPAPVEIYATFVRPISEETLQLLVNGLNGIARSGAPRIHLLFQSTGGWIGEGIALYNYLRAMPAPLTLYNIGQVSSIATVAYLGAQRRLVSRHATFMIHRTRITPTGPTTVAGLAAIRSGLTVDDGRTEAILRHHLILPDAQWTALDHHDVHLTAEEAVTAGLAHDLGEWAPPLGTQLFNL